MKKRMILILCMLLGLSLFGCGSASSESEEQTSLSDGTEQIEEEEVISSQYANMRVIEKIYKTGKNYFNEEREFLLGKIMVDDEEGVLYFLYRDPVRGTYVITPLYHADGTLKNIKEYEN